MKEVVLTVGPQGCGKTTFCKAELSNYFRISQDEMGKDYLGHFVKAMERGEKLIVVDRMNHLRGQRRAILELAKKFSYNTRIITMHKPYKTCYANIMLREGHPTLTPENPKIVERALSMFFSQYDYVLDTEADIVERSFYDPFMFDISNIYYGDRKILIGDVHGCYDEMMNLLVKCDYHPRNDVILLAGDFLDRGPKIKETLNFIRDGFNIFTVMSNHENKFLRYLRGNNITVAHGMEKTLEQFDSILRDEEAKRDLHFWLESLPYVIKFADDKYICHAGINPQLPMERQNRENLIYARSFNPETKSFTDAKAPDWYSFEGPPNTKVYFGHQVHDKALVAPWAVALDAGCVSGQKLRASVFKPYPDAYEEIVEVNGKDYMGNEPKAEFHESLVPYENLVKEKYLSKSEKGNLVLYKYAEKAAHERFWNEYTIKARGIIFEKSTGKVIANTMPKFFNLGEHEATFLKNLPELEYVTTEKMYGSCLTLFWYDGKWDVATLGSFYSTQAERAREIITKTFDDLSLKIAASHLTLVFECIYPENKIVVNYGTKEGLVLLTAYDNDGKELTRLELVDLAERAGLELVTTYDLSITEMIELQKTLPKDQEGFVIRYSNGLRVKIKGEAYMLIHHAISNLTPLNVHRAMVNGKVKLEYLVAIPEEIKADMESLKTTLESNYALIHNEVLGFCQTTIEHVGTYSNSENFKRNLGIYLQSNNLKHSGAVWPYLLERKQHMDDYIMDQIRPKGNML